MLFCRYHLDNLLLTQLPVFSYSYTTMETGWSNPVLPHTQLCTLTYNSSGIISLWMLYLLNFHQNERLTIQALMLGKQSPAIRVSIWGLHGCAWMHRINSIGIAVYVYKSVSLLPTSVGVVYVYLRLPVSQRFDPSLKYLRCSQACMFLESSDVLLELLFQFGGHSS